MKRVFGILLAAILFSATLVSFSYAQAACCAGGGCCSTSNTWGDQQRFRVSSTGFDQTQLGTVKMAAPQINPKRQSVRVSQIGAVRLAPTSVSTAFFPGKNSTGGYLNREPKSPVPSRSDTSIVDRIMAFTPVPGTLW